MSQEKAALGRWDPHSTLGRHAIWNRAIEDFLWPTVPDEKQREIRDHRIFAEWASDLGARMHLFPCGSSYFKKFPTPNDLIASRANRYGGKSMSHAAALVERFSETWAGMVSLDGKGAIIPASRKSAQGLKFCLLVNVLRYGVQDGTPPVEGRHGLAKWRDAVDAASLLLALSLLSQRLPGAEYEFAHVPWRCVKESAASKLGAMAGSITDLDELRGHAPGEGMEGFRKRLRACMDEVSFKRITGPAAAFERQGAKGGSRGLVKWRNKELLSNWFVVGRD